MTKIKTIVFDWDGTIVDSLALKRDAWFTIFPKHTKAYFAIQKLSLGLKTSTRSQILANVFDMAGDGNISKEEFVSKYSSAYRKEVEKGILRNGFLPGAKETLEKLNGKVPLYLNSATPTEPLLFVVEKIGASKYFKGIYGRSISQENHTQHDLKVENLRDIAKKENINPKEMIMVGDAESDERSAQIFGCQFVHASKLSSL